MVLVFLWSSLALAAAIVLANLLVDPTGEYGTGLFRPLAWTDRDEKARLLERLRERPPQAAILGSSRTMKLEPSYVATRTGWSCFNASVSSARAEDFLAFAGLLLDDLHAPLRLVVLGLDVEALHDGVPMDRRLLTSRLLAPHLGLPWPLRLEQRLQGLAEAFSFDRLRTTAAVLRATLTHYPPRLTALDADGFLHYLAWEASLAAGTFDLRAGLEDSKREYERRFQGYTAVDDDRLLLLERALRRFRDAGADVVVYLTPLQPELAAHLGRTTAYDRLRGEVVAKTSAVAARTGARFLDLSDLASFGGKPDEFFDGAHMRESNARRLLDHVVAR